MSTTTLHDQTVRLFGVEFAIDIGDQFPVVDLHAAPLRSASRAFACRQDIPATRASATASR